MEPNKNISQNGAQGRSHTNALNMVSLELKDTDFVAMPINSIKTSSGKGREAIDGPQYKKSAHIDIVSSKGILVKGDNIKRDQELGFHTNG